jgi:hypothetical protein
MLGWDELAAASKQVSWIACLVGTGTISARRKTGQARTERRARTRDINDPVRLSFLTALLADAGIAAVVLDSHTSVVEGSIGAIPRRLAVQEADEVRARRVLAEAGEI